MIQYEKLSTNDMDEDHETGNELVSIQKNSILERTADNTNTIENGEHGKEITVRNDKPYPISKPPPKPRDFVYSLIFVLHILAILLLSVFEQKSLNHSMIDYGKAGSWSSMLMIVTLLGSFIGAVVAMVIGSFVDARENILNVNITFSLILKIALGNVLLIIRSKYSFVGALILFFAVLDLLRMKGARENLTVTSALIQMTIDNAKSYKIGFFITCGVIISAQTCILLWWGAFFTGIISTVSSGPAGILITSVMLLSLFWITAFFHSIMSFVVGGCILWLFVKEEHEPIKAGNKLLLYLTCSVSTSIGSCCKGSLFVPLAQSLLNVHHWSSAHYRQLQNTRCSGVCCVSTVLQVITKPLLGWAKKHHKLSYALMATYGRTLNKSAEDHAEAYPETLDICIEDSTYYTLNCVCVVVASVISILFGLFAEKKEGDSWPLFFFVCFYLSYCGLSLSIHIYSSAVDALIVASALNPVRFAKGNQIIFLRFLRSSESELR